MVMCSECGASAGTHGHGTPAAATRHDWLPSWGAATSTRTCRNCGLECADDVTHHADRLRPCPGRPPYPSEFVPPVPRRVMASAFTPCGQGVHQWRPVEGVPLGPTVCRDCGLTSSWRAIAEEERRAWSNTFAAVRERVVRDADRRRSIVGDRDIVRALDNAVHDVNQAALDAQMRRFGFEPWEGRWARFWREVAAAAMLRHVADTLGECARESCPVCGPRWVMEPRRDVAPEEVTMRPGEPWLANEIEHARENAAVRKRRKQALLALFRGMVDGLREIGIDPDPGRAPCPASPPHEGCNLCRGTGRVEAL